MNAIPLEQEMEYPSSDGKPVAESPEHLRVMIDLISGLMRRYAKAPLGGRQLPALLREGQPKARVSPDVLVAKGVIKEKPRRNYLLWDEKPPSLVIEVTSLETWRRDTKVKKSLYKRIGTEEYVLFDPLEEYLRPSLQGYRLLQGRYEPIPLEADGSLLSRTTGLLFRREGYRLRMVDMDVIIERPILWTEELYAAHRAAEARVAEEVAARQAAEVRAAEEAAVRKILERQIRALEEELALLRRS